MDRPHSVEAEQQVLGAILLNPDRINAVVAGGGASLFHDPCHADLFKLIAREHDEGRPVTPVTIANKPAVGDRLRDLGGKGYIARLAGASIAGAQVAEYVKHLSDLHIRRTALDAIEDAAQRLRGDEQAGDIIARLEAALMRMEAADGAKPVSLMKAVTGALQEAHAAYAGEERPIVKTGIWSLDNLVSGFGAGELVLVGGRPSMGKSAVALSVALRAAKGGHGVIMASLEMTPEAMATRALAEATAGEADAVSFSSIKSGEMTERQFGRVKEAAEKIAGLPVHFLSRAYSDVDALYAGVRQAARLLPEGKMPLIVIDYAQLLRSNARGRYEQITEISIALKTLAMQIGAPVVALSQLSRSLEQREDKRPMLSDLRESGQLEQDADTVIFCYRDEYYLERAQPSADADVEDIESWRSAFERSRNRLELIVAKQRQGPIGTAHVRFNPALNYIWEQ